MIKTTTQNDLILYAYNESGLSDSDRVQRSIDGDPILQQEFTELVKSMNVLDDILVKPSDQSVEKILAYSRASKS